MAKGALLEMQILGIPEITIADAFFDGFISTANRIELKGDSLRKINNIVSINTVSFKVAFQGSD